MKNDLHETKEQLIIELDELRKKNKEREDKEKEHYKNIELLAQTAMRFVEFSSNDNIYDFIGHQIKKMLDKDSYVIVNSIDIKTGISTIQSALGLGSFADKIITFLGKKPVGMKFEVEDFNQHYVDGKLHLYEDGLYGLLLKTVPETLCIAMEKLVNIEKVYTIDIAKKGQFFGSVIILLKKGVGEIKNKQIIETFIKQASIAIQRRQTEEELIASNQQLLAIEQQLRATNQQLDANNQQLIANASSLKDSERKFKSLYDNAPLSYQSLNEDGTFRDVNNKWLRILGYHRNEVIGKKYADFLHPDWKSHFEENFSAFKKRGYVHDVQFKIRHKDGHYLDISFEGCIGYNPDGSFKQTYCVFQDISERIKVQEALKESQATLLDAQKLSNIGSWSLDFKTKKVKVSDEMLNLFGITDKNEVLDMSDHEKFYTPESWKRVNDAMEIAMVTGENISLEIDFAETNLRFHHVISKSEVVYDDNKKIIGLKGTLQDITKRKQYEKQIQEKNKQLLQQTLSLEESEKKFRTIFENAPIMVNSFDKNGKCILWNKECEKVHGYTKEELDQIDDPFSLFYPDKNLRDEVFNTIINNPDKEFREWEGRTKAGNTIFVNWANFRISDEMVISIGVDVTESKKKEKELLESETRFKALHNASFGGITIHDKGKILECNNGLSKITGYKKEELIGMDGLLLIAEEAREIVMQNIVSGYEKPYEVIGIRKNGEKYPLRLEAKEIPYKNKMVRVVEFRDITESKRKEQEIIKLSTAVKQSPSIIVITDMEGNIDYANPKFTKVTGYTEEDIKKLSIAILKSDNFSNSIYKDLWETIVSGKEWHGEFHNKKKNGDLYWERALIAPIFDSNNKIINFIKVAEDITEIKRNEAELLKMEKLSSIGTLAGGIAHDFNNILTGIYGNVSMAMMDLEKTHPSYSYLAETEKSMYRATQLTRQLLTFSKGGAPIKEDVDLTKIIVDTVKFDLSGSNVKPIFNFDKNLQNAEVDKGQIQQVFSNLAINANQASPNGGHLYITITNVFVENKSILNLKPGNYLKIIVQDEGSGIPKKYIENIFDPYFTTKETGNGLGLATTYSIIKKHKGHLAVESEFGKGTKFTIYLPASKNAIKIDTESGIITNRKNISANVLIMDDEIAIQKIASKMLKRLGYQADCVSDGNEAISKYKESIAQNNPFDLIVMDLTIPGGMGGKEAVKHILDINPDAKVIVSSGYTSGGLLSNYKSFGFVDMIDKPYSLAKLKDVLYRVLNNDE